MFRFDLDLEEKKSFLQAGRIMGMTILQGGPKPCFLSETIVNEILSLDSTPTLLDIGDEEVKNQLVKVLEAPNATVLRKAITDSDFLQSIGTPAPSTIVLEDKNRIIKGMHLLINVSINCNCCFVGSRCSKILHIDRPSRAITQFINGLKQCHIYDILKQFPVEAKHLLCLDSDQILTPELVYHLFRIHYSEDGTNQKRVEMKIMSFWREYLQLCHDGLTPVNLAQVLQFATGYSNLPALGFENNPTLKFDHNTNLPAAEVFVLNCILRAKELIFEKFLCNMNTGITVGIPFYRL